MKRYLLTLFTVLILVLAACGSEESPSDEVTDVEIDNEELEDVDETENAEENSSEDGKLTEVGQVIKDSQLGATLELMAIKEINETINLNTVKLTIDDIKIIRLTDIKSTDTKNYLSQFTDKEEFDYIQIMYSIENTTDENIEFYYPIEHVVLNTGEQIDVVISDIMLHPENGGEFFGKVTKDAGISVIINKSNQEEIESLKLITGDVWKMDGDQLHSEEEITYELK